MTFILHSKLTIIVIIMCLEFGIVYCEQMIEIYGAGGGGILFKIKTYLHIYSQLHFGGHVQVTGCEGELVTFKFNFSKHFKWYRDNLQYRLYWQ